MIENDDTVFIPADVPQAMHELYKARYQAITKNKDRLLLFACDQKIEHLNKDFYGANIDSANNNPEHLFRIAQAGYVGAFATHLGLINQYGQHYPTINYVVKMNGKTDLINTEHKDPYSKQLWTIEQILSCKKNRNLPIVGVGYTLYLGSCYESEMLAEAAQLIYQAHQQGLLTILWVYPRGRAVVKERAGDLIAGAAGVAASLGADFAKVNAPLSDAVHSSCEWLNIAAQAAGKTKLLVAGGSKVDDTLLLQELQLRLLKGSIAGMAVGRNIHQRSLEHAIELTKFMNEVIYGEKFFHTCS